MASQPNTEGRLAKSAAFHLEFQQELPHHWIRFGDFADEAIGLKPRGKVICIYWYWNEVVR